MRATPPNPRSALDARTPLCFYSAKIPRMRGTLHNIERGPEPHTFEVTVSIGDAPARTYRVSYKHYEQEGNMSSAKVWDTGNLLSRITELGDRGMVNNWFYEHEMMLLLHAFDRGETMPQLPVELGTTRFWKPPGIFKILRSKILRFLWRHGLFQNHFPGVVKGHKHAD